MATMDCALTFRFARTTLYALCAILIANTSQAQQHSDDATWQAVGDVAFDDSETVSDSPVCECGKAKHCPGVCRDPGHPAKPKRDKPGDIDRGDCPSKRYRMRDCERAGNPHKVAPWARCGVTEKYSAWFVGGGAAFCKGRPRKQTEGTWGTDYSGLFGKANVWLKYTRHREQGGEGAYETDGEPELVSRLHHLLHR